MQAIREYAVVKNRLLVLELPEFYNDTEVEVLVPVKKESEKQKTASESWMKTVSLVGCCFHEPDYFTGFRCLGNGNKSEGFAGSQGM